MNNSPATEVTRCTIQKSEHAMDVPIPQRRELHPMLVHFQIAFLLVVVLLMLTGYIGGSIVYHPSFTIAMTHWSP